LKLAPSGRSEKKELLKSMVGVTGFEPATPTSRMQQAIDAYD
jgi:hypothetical protein